MNLEFGCVVAARRSLASLGYRSRQSTCLDRGETCLGDRNFGVVVDVYQYRYLLYENIRSTWDML